MAGRLIPGFKAGITKLATLITTKNGGGQAEVAEVFGGVHDTQFVSLKVDY